MTSAVRDAANGAAFSARVAEALGFEARILSGDEEARLTYAGATAGRDGEFLVIDIGGGSTELVLGEQLHVSTQIGVVRHGERHLHADPPTPRAARRAQARRPPHPRRARPGTAARERAARDRRRGHADPVRGDRPRAWTATTPNASRATS